MTSSRTTTGAVGGTRLASKPGGTCTAKHCTERATANESRCGPHAECAFAVQVFVELWLGRLAPGGKLTS